MTLVAREPEGGSFEPAPSGTHLARCVQVIDLGTQYSKFYDSSKHKVLIGWELPDETDDKGEPRLVWKRYTMSLHENARLRHDLEQWRGRQFTAQELEGFSLENILDIPCLISITHRQQDNKTFADVSGVMALAKSQRDNVPPRVHDIVKFDLDNPDAAIFETFSDNLKQTIRSAEEAPKVASIIGVSDANGNGRTNGRSIVDDAKQYHANAAQTASTGGIDPESIPF